jgi:hypothetical protein
MKKRVLWSVVIMVMACIGIYGFIRLNNDHLECGEQVQKIKDEKGNIVLLKQHICREKYSF